MKKPKTYPFKEESRQVPRSMNYVVKQAKEMILAIANLYGHNGYECSIELTEGERTRLWLKVNYRKGKGVSRWEEINQEIQECPGIVLSDIPGGTCLPYERLDKAGQKHKGYLRVIFSGFSFGALDQEASVRLISYLSPMIEATEPSRYKIRNDLLLLESFSAYIMFKLELVDLMRNRDKDDNSEDY